MTEPLPTTRHLLPHERWGAAWLLARQQALQTPQVLRLQRNYGPEGLVLKDTVTVNILVGLLVGWTGVGLVFASKGYGSLGVAGYALIGAGFCIGLLGTIRQTQAVQVARQFREGRPPEKAPRGFG